MGGLLYFSCFFLMEGSYLTRAKGLSYHHFYFTFSFLYFFIVCFLLDGFTFSVYSSFYIYKINFICSYLNLTLIFPYNIPKGNILYNCTHDQWALKFKQWSFWSHPVSDVSKAYVDQARGSCTSFFCFFFNGIMEVKKQGQNRRKK